MDRLKELKKDKYEIEIVIKDESDITIFLNDIDNIEKNIDTLKKCYIKKKWIRY